MKAFVTGATGFIGRRFIEKLRKEGFEVIALVRNEKHGLPKGIHVVYGDILEPESLGDSGLGCDRLYHLAGMITFDPRLRNELLRVNGQGTANILSASHRWKVKRTVIVSSACTVGLSYAKGQILDEGSPLDKRLVKKNPYLESKLAAEKAAIAAAENQIVVVVNPTTVYGPGDRSLNSGALVLRIASSAIVPLPPGGSNVVDVDDVVEGILAAGEYGQAGRRYILGGENLSFSQIFTTMASVVKHHPILIPLPIWIYKPVTGAAWFAGQFTKSRFLTPQILGDMFAFKYYSNALAKQELGWIPRYSFQESVRRAWDFYQQEGFV